MEEHAEFSRMEQQLELKIAEINHIKTLLLRQINQVQDSRLGAHQVRAACSKFSTCVHTLRELMGVLRKEIKALPVLLQQETSSFALKIKQGISAQWGCHLDELNRLRSQVAARTDHNHFLQQRISELDKQLWRFQSIDENCRTPLQEHQLSVTDDAGGISPAIEYPVGRLEDSDVGTREQEHTHSRFQGSQIDVSTVAKIKTEPRSYEDANAFSFSQRSVSYGKIEPSVIQNKQKRAKNFISGFRQGVEVTNVMVGYDNPFSRVAGSAILLEAEPMRADKRTPDRSIERPNFSLISITKKPNNQEAGENRQNKKPPTGVDKSRRADSKQMQQRKESKQKIQVTYKDRLKGSELSIKDCNIPQRRQSKEKIHVTVKGQETGSSQLSRSGISKLSEDLSVYSGNGTGSSWLQTELELIDLYIGDKRTEQRYEGQKRDEIRCGRGRLEYVNGLLYEGDFSEGMRHGKGTLSLNGKMIYEGQWRKDRICGKGLLRNIYLVNKRKLEEGSSLRYSLYEGYFQDNRFQGYGTLLLSNGERVTGSFSKGMLSGQLGSSKQGWRHERIPRELGVK